MLLAFQWSFPPGEEHPVNAPDQFGLLRIDHEVPILPSVVAEETVERNGDLAVCKALPLAPRAVLRDGPGFFLRQRRHDRE